MSLSLARELAFDAYRAVIFAGEKPQDVLDRVYAQESQKLRRLDRNFIKELVYGSLRWHAKLFWILQQTSRRDLSKSSPEIQVALILGAYQIFHMDRVPDRAAVNESVEYVRERGQPAACSFINGILRQLSRRTDTFTKPDPKVNPVEYLSVQFSHPAWLVKRWLERFKIEKLALMLDANNQPPPNTVRLNALKVSLGEASEVQHEIFKNDRIPSERRPLRSALRLGDAPSFEPDGLFAQGIYTVQDEASQLIAHLVAPKPGESIVDACAGPGGKLGHIFELGQEKIQLVAVEQGERQMQRAKDGMQRLGFTQVEYVAADFLNWRPAALVDKVLLDSPCSGLGVLRRHPEGKWNKEPKLIEEMATRQASLIRHALSILKVGGELVYSVCSFEPEETSQHLKSLRKDFGEAIEAVSPALRLPDYYKKYVTRDNVLLIYSGNEDAMDGFGAFIIRKKAELPT